MKSLASRCFACDEVITNPICSQCLAGQMKVVVGEYDQKLARRIVGFSSPASEGDMVCITCSQSMSLCAHCFSKDIYEYLSENNTQIAEEFINRFDFDLRQELM